MPLARHMPDDPASARGAYCEACELVFEHAARDRFDGAVFCPRCVTRVDDTELSLDEVVRRHRLRLVRPLLVRD